MELLQSKWWKTTLRITYSNIYFSFTQLLNLYSIYSSFCRDAGCLPASIVSSSQPPHPGKKQSLKETVPPLRRRRCLYRLPCSRSRFVWLELRFECRLHARARVQYERGLDTPSWQFVEPFLRLRCLQTRSNKIYMWNSTLCTSVNNQKYRQKSSAPFLYAKLLSLFLFFLQFSFQKGGKNRRKWTEKYESDRKEYLYAEKDNKKDVTKVEVADTERAKKMFCICGKMEPYRESIKLSWIPEKITIMRRTSWCEGCGRRIRCLFVHISGQLISNHQGNPKKKIVQLNHTDREI